jgi:hypothetical protein
MLRDYYPLENRVKCVSMFFFQKATADRRPQGRLEPAVRALPSGYFSHRPQRFR